jgi:hypothetical protein
VLAAVLLVAGAIAVQTAAAQPRSRSCSTLTRGMRLVALQPTGGGAPLTRVVARQGRVRTAGATYLQTTHYGCTERARRLIRLGVARSDNLSDPQTDDVVRSFTDIHIAGPYVAFVEGSFDQGVDDPSLSSLELVGLVDLQRGRRLTARFCPRGLELYCGQQVSGLALTAQGAAAWIITALQQDTALPPNRAVWIRDGAGLRQLDRGTDVDPDSTALGRRSVSWIRGGVLRSERIS